MTIVTKKIKTEILTKKQKEAYLKLTIEKLRELTHLPELKDLLKEMQLAFRGEEKDGPSISSPVYWKKDAILILSSTGLIERKYIPGYRPPWPTIIPRKRVLKEKIVSEKDFEEIIHRYKLTPEFIQTFINALQAIPSV
jgi:hypothetical protein